MPQILQTGNPCNLHQSSKRQIVPLRLFLSVKIGKLDPPFYATDFTQVINSIKSTGLMKNASG